MNKSFVDYVVQDYTKPMGVATYKTSKDMSDDLRNALPDVETLKQLLDSEEDIEDKENVKWITLKGAELETHYKDTIINSEQKVVFSVRFLKVWDPLSCRSDDQ